MLQFLDESVSLTSTFFFISSVHLSSLPSVLLLLQLLLYQMKPSRRRDTQGRKSGGGALWAVDMFIFK